MALSTELPEERQDPWYSKFVQAWNDMTGFVNGLEEDLNNHADTNSVGIVQGLYVNSLEDIPPGTPINTLVIVKGD